jgi:hypothetical protein
MPVDVVAEDEVLYRRIPQSKDLYAKQANGTIKVSSQAFSDRAYRPSVDRANLCDHNPRHTQLAPSDAVVSLVTHDVRSIDTIERNDQHGNPIQSFRVDVESVPMPENRAHAEICTLPECDQKTFRRLREALALLANQREWEIEPPEL